MSDWHWAGLGKGGDRQGPTDWGDRWGMARGPTQQARSTYISTQPTPRANDHATLQIPENVRSTPSATAAMGLALGARDRNPVAR